MWKFFTKDAAEKQQLATPPVTINPVARVIVPTAVVTNGVWTFLAYSTEEIDTDNMVDLVAQSRRITIQHSGKYLLSATTTWAANATGGRGVRFVKNGVTLYDGSGMEGGSISGFGPSSSAIIDCVAGDYLEMQVYQSSGGTINLGISTFQAAKVDGAVINYVPGPSSTPGTRVRKVGANMSIPNITWTPITFDTELFDTDNIHDNVTNPSRLTCRTAGVYVISGHLRFDSTAGGTVRDAAIFLNGVPSGVPIAIDDRESAQPNQIFSISTIYKLNVGDYVELCAYHNVGSAIGALVTAEYGLEFAMVKIG